MRNRAMAAVDAVLVLACMRIAIVYAAIRRHHVARLQNMLVDMIVVNVMQMAVVQIVRVCIVLHRRMSAARAMHVVVALVGLMHQV